MLLSPLPHLSLRNMGTHRHCYHSARDEEIKAQRLGNQRDSRQQLGREVALPWRADSVYPLLLLQFGKLEYSPSFTDEEIGKHTFLEVL